MNVSLVNLNNLSENELNEFIFKFLSLLKNNIAEDNKEELYKLIINKLFEINQSHKKSILLVIVLNKLKIDQKK